MTRRRPIVGGNWKMNTDLASAVELAEDVSAGCAGLRDRCEVVLFPPFPYLQAVGRALGHHGLLMGAQDVWYEPNGAFTGEVSAEMLLDLNASMVIVGHSERRHVIGEDDGVVNRKLRAALDAGLKVIFCVGESLEQREAGAAEEVVEDQLEQGLEGVTESRMRDIVIAYEPVWAIGTGRTATPDDADSMHRAVRETVSGLYSGRVAQATRIQYGGSVKPGNAAELIGRENVDGFLVGGASLKADDFLAIVGTVSDAVHLVANGKETGTT